MPPGLTDYWGPSVGISFRGVVVDRSSQFAADAAAGALPALSMVWHDNPADEHPPDVTIGHDTIWQAVTAVVQAGLRDTTVFLLSWDGREHCGVTARI